MYKARNREKVDSKVITMQFVFDAKKEDDYKSLIKSISERTNANKTRNKTAVNILFAIIKVE